MISINGKRFLGGSVTIVNGRIIKGGKNGKHQKFDEKKVENCRNIELYIEAIKDINVNISSMSGDITAEFSNIGYINLYTNSMSGSVRNRHKEVKDGYNADVDISTMSGDIRIR